MEENQTPQQQSGTRKYFTAQEKFKIIKEHLTTKTAVTEICKKYDVNASQFYRWQELFFEGALGAFDTAKRGPNGADQLAQRKFEEAERELKRRQDVIMELAAEVVTLKKTPGALLLRR